MIVSRFFVEFIIFSLAGWIYESIYCTIRNGHWQNRGFLFGPVCPIYGFGAMSVRLLAYFVVFDPGKSIPLWQFFLGFMAGSAVLEYVTSWGMEKLFHSRWWDYSDMSLNLNGRICLPASLLFGLAGTLGWVYIIPILPKTQNMSNSLLVEVFSLLLMAVFAADFIISIDATRNLIKKLEMGEEMFNDAAERGVLKIRSIPGRVHDAGSKVKGTTKSIGSKMRWMIMNPSVQLKEFALKLSDREKGMLSRIQSYHPIGNLTKLGGIAKHSITDRHLEEDMKDGDKKK